MPATLLLNADLLTPDDLLMRTPLLIDGGRIVAIGSRARVENAERVDLAGHTVAPGFIDLHVHGGGGFSLAGCHPEAIASYAQWVTRFGVTGFLAGAIGSSAERIERALAEGASMRGNSAAFTGGAPLLGIHLEGPFLSSKRRGAFNAGWLLAPDASLVDQWTRAAQGALALITLAPELPRADEAIRAAIALGTRVSLGHTDARYEEMIAGFEFGARHVTHCFNAMRPFGHRDPGAIAAALTAPGVQCEVIADGEHVAAGALRLLFAARGAASTVLVTDGIQLAGFDSGSFEIAGETAEVRAGRAATGAGTLAGSIATMDICVRNAVSLGNATLNEAVRMASLNPATAIGVDGTRGRVAPGYRADLVALSADLRVASTWVAGERVFSAAAP